MQFDQVPMTSPIHDQLCCQIC